jgi:hypothetical protein
MSVLQKLTEGIVNRDLQKEGDALLNKWEKTGLLEGLGSDHQKNGMAVLLENQAKELLREASAMAAGDVEGFAAVAFPIVRRVFGGLIANQLVSVQPMSLPSGLIFFLDFTFNTGRAGQAAGESLYGGNVVASGLLDGVDLAPTGDTQPGGFYGLGTGYASPTGSAAVTTAAPDGSTGDFPTAVTDVAVSALTDAQKKMIQYDPDILADASLKVTVHKTPSAGTTSLTNLNSDALTAIDFSGHNGTVVRRLTRVDKNDSKKLVFVLIRDAATPTAPGSVTIKYPLADNFDAAGTGKEGGVVGNDPWGLEEASNAIARGSGTDSKDVIPEIDIKVDSTAVTAVTKKLKAKWTPELAQDLNAYHNLDAEVELTSILSEQIALEIDREILNDLVKGATAETLYWSRRPGRFIDRGTGADISTLANESLLGGDFTGTVSEWYETLIETINDVSAQIHRKTLRGGANFIVVGPETANVLEFTAGFRASVTADVETGQAGAVKIGAISKKWDVYVDPYFMRNVVLVGRKGSSFLESGYVYAPYVPLQVTPTIFGVEDFVPRKGVMTRYAKKMVRPDAYGLVIIKDLNG